MSTNPARTPTSRAPSLSSNCADVTALVWLPTDRVHIADLCTVTRGSSDCASDRSISLLVQVARLSDVFLGGAEVQLIARPTSTLPDFVKGQATRGGFPEPPTLWTTLTFPLEVIHRNMRAMNHGG